MLYQIFDAVYPILCLAVFFGMFVAIPLMIARDEDLTEETQERKDVSVSTRRHVQAIRKSA